MVRLLLDVVVPTVVVVEVVDVDLGLLGLSVVESLAHPLNSVVVLVLKEGEMQCQC